MYVPIHVTRNAVLSSSSTAGTQDSLCLRTISTSARVAVVRRRSIPWVLRTAGTYHSYNSRRSALLPWSTAYTVASPQQADGYASSSFAPYSTTSYTQYTVNRQDQKYFTFWRFAFSLVANSLGRLKLYLPTITTNTSLYIWQNHYLCVIRGSN
jgi:hypothetical protein